MNAAHHGIMANAGKAPSLLFDLYAGEAQSFSGLARKTGQGNLWRVYRKQDAVEQDFTAAQLAAGEHTTFVLAGGGVNHGLVSAVYDLSGAGRHLYQAVEGNMPTCVYSGTAVTIGGKPVLAYGTHAQSVNAQSWLQGAGLLLGTNYTINDDYSAFVVFEPAGTDGTARGVYSQISNTLTYFNLCKGGGMGNMWGQMMRDLTGEYSGNNTYSAGQVTTAAQVSAGFFNKTARTKVHYKNLALANSASAFQLTRGYGTARLTIGCGYDEFTSTRLYYNGKIGDVFFYKTNMRLADREAITQVLITDYGIS